MEWNKNYIQPTGKIQEKIHWTLEETLELVKQRRLMLQHTAETGRNSQEIAELNMKMKCMSIKDKTNHINNACQD